MSHPILLNGLGSPQSYWQTSTIQHHKVGTKGEMGDGRVFYYTSLAAGGTTLLRANLLVANPAVANHVNVAQATSGANLTVGATSVLIDVGATAVTANQYNEGWLNINDSTGEGFEYKIRSHATSAGSAPVRFELYDPIVIAGGTGSDVSLHANQYTNPLISANNGLIVGVPKVGVVAHATLDTWYWTQTWGECTVLSGVAVTLGAAGVWSATDGSITIGAAATETELASALILTVSTEHQLMYLKIRA